MLSGACVARYLLLILKYEFKVSKNDDYDYVTTPDSVINHTQSVMLYASLNEDATGKVTCLSKYRRMCRVF